MMINFIGGGNIAQAIINGLIKNNYSKNDIHVLEINPVQISKIESELGVSVSNSIDMSDDSIIILAVKPNQIELVCKNIRLRIKDHLVISVAAGVKTEKICQWLGGYKNIVRAMPNLSAKIQQGITALYVNKDISSSRKEEANNILKSVGKVIWLDDEDKIDAVTALSGSGPAYVFMFIEALIVAGQKIGLSLEEAQILSYSTIYGSALLAENNTTSLDDLIKNVTSKGGTTEQGIKVLNDHNFKEIIQLATEAAYNRAKEIGNN